MSEHETEPAVDEPDEPLDPEDEPELDPEADQELAPEGATEPAGDEEADKPSSQVLLEALEKEHKRHAKALAKALDLDPEAMHECPTCEGIGYTPEPLAGEVELVQDPYTETCERCGGNGRTLTGATHLGLYEKPCGLCGSRGYVDLPEHPEAGAEYANGAAPPTAAPAAPAIATAEDVAVAELRMKGYTIVEPIVLEPVPAT